MQNSNQENSNWESFWKENPTEFNSTMLQSTLFFAKSLAKSFPINAKNRFLDIGCGPGFLIDYLKDKCELVHGTDISEKYIEICKQRFKSEKNLSFSVSKVYDFEIYNQLIIDYQIDRVIFMSVLQYYKGEKEVKELLLSLKKTANKQKFSCLLADIIPTKHSTVGDIFSILKHAIKKGYTLKFVKFLVYAVFSNYSKIKKSGLLQIDQDFFIILSEELKVDIKIIKDLTLHTGRYSVLINF
ncbi:MAG: class I SAM-dependent methyltransferase [Pedobacter sp.]|nr:class I SAM-dependent methyltransferase [Pedobacter sp.]